MDEKKSFTILGISAAREENAIREAYRKLLRSVNPEDDPEGFRQLREAYEAALSFAQKPEEEAVEQADTTPSGLFVAKASALYASLSGRQDENAWRALFREPVFLDLEEEEACREKLTVFLMDHCYLPTNIWTVLGDKLQFEQDKEKLCEKFPGDFVNYLIRKTTQGEDFEFSQLEGPDDADLDQWIALYAKANREENAGNYEALEETIEQAEQMGVTHPGLSMMKARLLQHKAQGSCPEADDIVEELIAGPFSDSVSVRYQSAEYYWQSGNRERSIELYKKLYEKMRKHYMANRRLAEWYYSKGQYAQAKECANVMLSVPLDDEGKKLVESINAGLERELFNKVTVNPEDLKARIELGWCYLQDEEPLKAIELLETVTPDATEEKDYSNLMGKVYYYAKQYDKAAPAVQRWAELLREQLPADEEAKQEDMERLATAHSMLAQMTLAGAKEAEGEEREEAFAKVLKELDLAQQAHYNPGQDYARAMAYYEWGKKKECADICTGLKEHYPDFEAAWMLHQRACADLYDAAGVIGDYFSLRKMAPEYALSWELAAEVYYQLKRREELDKLLADAQENGVFNSVLKKYRFYRMADEAETRQQLMEALDYAAGISEEWQDWEPARKAELLSERARHYWRIENYDKARTLIDDAIRLAGNNCMYLYIKAGILKDQHEFEDAVKLYLSCEKDYDETPHYYANVGECYYKTGRQEQALPFLKKAVELKSDNPMCYVWIIRTCRDIMESSDSDELLPEAESYADRMVEERPEAYFYIERGLLYVTVEDYETAAGNFELAVEKDSENPFGHSNLARMYRLLGRLTDAQKHGGLAVANMERDPSPFHHEVMGDICRTLHMYPEAIACWKVNWDRFQNRRIGFLSNMIPLYLEAGKWQDALDLLQQAYKGKGKDGSKKTVQIYCSAEYYDQAVRCVKNYYKLAGFEEPFIHEEYADIYWYQGNLKKAMQHYRLALRKYPQDKEGYADLLRKAADTAFFLGKKDQAAAWAAEALSWHENHEGYKKWLNPLQGRQQNLLEAGLLKLYTGNAAVAEEIVAEIKQCTLCVFCVRRLCLDALELEASVLIEKADYAAAVSLYEAILKESPADRDVRSKLRLIRGRV